ncbi:MAG: nicotinate phosphoribosyltransferase [Actinobacteria bacterium]|nr:nicotinate phosphoribosyltransferase [Actinomycetota bacterium]
MVRHRATPIRSLPLVTVPDSEGQAPGASTALLTDHYELTMLAGALRSGAAGRRSVFEVFARYLPHGRRYGVVAGTGRLLEALQWFRFGPGELEFLRETGVTDEDTLGFLESFEFTGDIWGYAEGDCYFPGSPILVVEAPFAQAVVLETLALSILNHDCAIASAASRMATAADGRPLIEMGSRRTHERAAVASARAAYLAGFATTSNLEAGREYGVPTRGTSAHAFTLVHDSERQAFATQLAVQGTDTTLLVDTYDVDRAVREAVELAGPGLGAVRIDSGDLPVVARQVRALLDELGAHQTRIVLTGDLDEHSIAALAASPVDGYGVGTALVTGSGAPTAALVYKLVARAQDAHGELRPVAKRSVGKPSRGGRKWAVRHFDEDGIAEAELVSTTPPTPSRPGRALLVPLVRDGKVVGAEPLAEARKRHQRALAELPLHALQLSRGYPAIPTLFEPDGR